ncbi:hypothetical protein CmeUKMEL1_05850 [Cryptosporidium meleagridis]|uniref:Uncharacterized protein n=1 Tax=Cryptosporidium meleagridis TaxID=93969 RepID=A0A2P4YZ76_9CRYT|nr:hypothetical protein CmeUKMEL1_05850 [Cryptosporidium meleagridis]
MADQQDVKMVQSDHQKVPDTKNELVLNEEKNTERSKIKEYCKSVLEKDLDHSINCDIIDQSEVSEFRSQVNKMKMWPSFDHIFKAARRDNKWYLRSQPLRGINKILFEEQKLINISKAMYKGLAIAPIPEGVIETAVQTIINSNDVLPEISDFVSSTPNSLL